VAAGVTAHAHSILTAGSVATKDMEAFGIYQGNPACLIKHRELKLPAQD
jgi:putative colanic acid biosynthesis acetyltransferase WcaF